MQCQFFGLTFISNAPTPIPDAAPHMPVLTAGVAVGGPRPPSLRIPTAGLQLMHPRRRRLQHAVVAANLPSLCPAIGNLDQI